MGNSNSGSFNTTHSPPPWTQSLPRDAHRQKKYGAMQGTKVLPERIPGQRLRPTENGRNLHHQGTISHRKLMESVSVPNQVIAPKISHQHSTSMSALNLSPSMAPRLISQNARVNDVILAERKTFKSEPDLREIPFVDNRYQQVPNSLHTIIHESPTKGRIMSKKRYKAPPPPEGHNTDLPIQLMYMENNAPVKKSRKVRIFKKNSTSKMAKNESEDDSGRRKDFEGERKSRKKKPTYGKDESKERTRSLDNLHFMQKNKENISYPMQIVSINTPDTNVYSGYSEKDKSGKDDVSKYQSRAVKSDQDHPYRGNVASCPTTSVDISNHAVNDKYFGDAFSESIINNKDNYNKVVDNTKNINNHSHIILNKEYQVVKREGNDPVEYAEDPWDKAEREWIEKKKNSEKLQKEIKNVAKNLKKVSSINLKNNNEKDTSMMQNNNELVGSNLQESIQNKNEPKTFFFGMDTKPNDAIKQEVKNCNDGYEVQHITITRSAMNDKVAKSVDRRDKIVNHKVDYNEASKADAKPISKKIDEFVANIERNKLNLKPNQAELLQSISHEDGGYHSRQSSETWQTENEKDDNEKIKIHLRPTLPKRQLELPRFSPNAAWRTLGMETSSRSKESSSDTLETPGSLHNHEEKQQRIKHVTSSRGSGEKSGDSGISGDGGSPGLVGDFEPIILKKRDVYNGPTAISSPISSSKLENKRAWTPAQDLDDNSFEDSGDHSSKLLPHEISSFPKLTSRTNMFADIIENEVSVNCPDRRTIDTSGNLTDINHLLNDNGLIPTDQNVGNSIAGKNTYNTSQVGADININEASWRENWSLSRSIPNSINKCGDNDCNSNSSYVYGTRSESRMSNVENKFISRPITPSYLQRGNNGHIMYLPQYKTYNIKYKPHIRECHSVNENEVTRHFLPEKSSCAMTAENQIRSARDIALEKKKKFAYKSTLRILEKRWLEEKISIDVKEKEESRLKEIDQIMKVEKEFRNKRENEKEKLKKQLRSMNSHQKNSSPVSNSTVSKEDQVISEINIDKYSHPPSSNIRKMDDTCKKAQSSSYNDYGYGAQENFEEPASFISGMKKWVRGRKKCNNGSGYISDASSTTITSASRQEPDGAPANNNRRPGEHFRNEVIAGSRSRNGSVVVGESPQSSEFESEVRYRSRGDFSSDMQSNTSVSTSVSPDQRRNYGRHSFVTKQPEHSGKRYMKKSSKSSEASDSSVNNSRKTHSSHIEGTLSPDSKISIDSEPFPISRELYEDNRLSRKNKEYHSSPRRPMSQQSIKYYKNIRDNELIDNYRRNFAQGQLLNYTQRSYPEEYDNNSRYSSDGRSSKRSGRSQRKNQSMDSLDSGPQRKSPYRQSLAYNYRVPPIDSSPARFGHNRLPSFNQPEEYRPVVFNSNSINKVLSVK